ncbi:hypothetical protein FIM06_1729 [Bacillus velezensis]|nr:hypothetical protein FIM06_1729 [Bacillus velezensis]QDF52439.1 hypothetical protein D069_1728 [Bacillus velezensis]
MIDNHKKDFYNEFELIRKSQNDAKEEKIRYETVNFYFYYVFIDYGIDNERLAGFTGISSRDKNASSQEWSA